MTSLEKEIRYLEDRLQEHDNTESCNRNVNHPSHYQSKSKEANIECIDAMRAAFGDKEVAIWCKINAFKYLYRTDNKGGITDMRKAQWYIDKFLELKTANNELQ